MGRSRDAALLLTLPLALLGAQSTCERSGPETVYALTADSQLARGCFEPLACPVAVSEDLGGTFRLRLQLAGDLFDLYEVREVFWLARIHGEDVPITGSGFYLDGVAEDQLQLNLRIGDEDVQAFDSGRVPGGPPGGPQLRVRGPDAVRRGLPRVYGARREPATVRMPEVPVRGAAGGPTRDRGR